MKRLLLGLILMFCSAWLSAQARPTFGSPSNNLEVEIRLSDAGDPLNLARVELFRAEIPLPSTYANARGEASWVNLTDGSYTVKVSLPGYLPGESSVELFNGTSRKLTMVLQPDPQRLGSTSVLTDDPLISARLLAAPEKARKEFDNAQKARQRGNCHSAIEHANKALSVAPKFEFAYLEIGMCNLSQGKLDLAREFFQTAIDINPKLLYGYIGLSNIEVNRGRWNEAAHLLGLANNAVPDRAEPFYELARIQVQVGQLERAELAAKTAMSKDFTRIPDAPFLLARIYALEGKKEEALKCLQNVVSLNPSNEIGARARRSMELLKAEKGKQ